MSYSGISNFMLSVCWNLLPKECLIDVRYSKLALTLTAVSFRPCRYGTRFLHSSCLSWCGCLFIVEFDDESFVVILGIIRTRTCLWFSAWFFYFQQWRLMTGLMSMEAFKTAGNQKMRSKYKTCGLNRMKTNFGSLTTIIVIDWRWR